MALTEQLNEVLVKFDANAPAPVKENVIKSRADAAAAVDLSNVIQPGAKLPDISLTDATGAQVTRDSLLARANGGPLLISFYRGGWCPFCNLELRALQKRLPDLEARGATLVAVSPELPDASLSTAEKNELSFAVLSDVGNAFARGLGLVWNMPAYLRPVFEKFGHDLVKTNGDDSFALPLPATLLVDRDGVVRNTFVEPDYTKRLEPDTALAWIDALAK